MKRVALIIALNSDGEVLMGKRRDNGKWTLPGGHLNEGEFPIDGAKRELKEETGLEVDVDDLKMVDQRELGNAQFFTFQCDVSGKPSGKDDPDQECGTWKFFDVSNGVPKEVHENMAGPRDKKKNVLTDVVGLAKMQRLAGFPKLGIDDRREVPIIDGDRQTKLKGLQVSWNLRQQFPGEPKSEMDKYGHDVIRGSHGASVSGDVPANTSFVNSNENLTSFHPKRKLSNTSDLSTQLHEGFHEMMNRVQNKHGRAARENLAHNLWNSIPYTQGMHHEHYGEDMSMYLESARRPEEKIASLHNYLNDASERERYHGSYGHDDAVRREASTSIKQAMKHLGGMAGHVDKRWLAGKMSRKQIGELVHGQPQFSQLPPGAKPKVPGQNDQPHSPETVKPEIGLQKTSVLAKAPVEGTLPHWNAQRSMDFINQDLRDGATVATKSLGILPDASYKIYNDTYHSPANGKPVYHHAVTYPGNTNTQHVLSLSTNPSDPPLAYMNVRHHPEDNQWNGVPTVTISHSPSRNFGFGTRLYQEALKHHGKLQSDSAVSASAGRVWSKLLSTPGVTGREGQENNRASRHYAETGLQKAGGYDEHGWPLQAPRGFVDPQGKFYPVGDEDHHDWVRNHVGADEDDADFEYGKLLKQGWMAVGVSGGNNVQGHRDHLSNPNHPATQVVRQLAKKHWGPKFEAMVHGGEDGNIDINDMDTAAFAHQGKLVPPNPMRKHDTPEFQQWFQGSKVATPEGQPLRVYHGTSKDQDFSTFKIGERGAWFTSNPAAASQYAADNDSMGSKFDHATGNYKPVNQAPRVIPAYLNLKNPYKMTPEDQAVHAAAPDYRRHQAELARRAKLAGHDGVDFGDGTYVAFHPHQIKGAFNPKPTSAKAFNKAEEMTKHEEPDEVMRMLTHPNKDERRMALKLGTVNDRHLARAFYDSDPAVARAALEHPAMSHGSLMALIRMPQSKNLQLAGMQHPLFNREHLRALYDHHKTERTPEIMDAITRHPDLYPELIQDMHYDGNSSRALIANQNTPADVIQDTIERHFMPGNDQEHPRRYEVMEALQHPNATPQLAELAIKHGDDGIKMAAAKSPNLPLNVIEDILKRGHTGNHQESFLRSALLGSKFASAKHLDMGLEDLNPLARSAVFTTQSPSLNEKHVDRAIEQGHPHTVLMALKSKAANPGHLSKIANHPDEKIRALAAKYQKKAAIVKYEEDLVGWLKINSLSKGNLQDIDPNSDQVRDMLGYDHNLMSTFEAAKFLIKGNQPSLEQVRKALWQADGDVEEAALIAYGLEVTEGNLRALRGIRDLREHKKSTDEPLTAQSIEPGVGEASQTAEAIKRAFADRFVFPVKLGGKHSGGSMLARDNHSGEVFLLKPGSGGISPAAGDQEESASQSRREAGFFHMADAWGLGNCLPETDLVIVDGKEYAAIKLLPWKYKTLDKLKKTDPTLPTKMLLPYLQRGLLHKWAVLDFVLGNPDRHANNLMADATGDTPEADVKLIDHGSAMAGEDFDPANDQNSFVPFYLRAWATGKFNQMTTEQKLKAMPRVDDYTASELHEWVASLDSHELEVRLGRYGIDPAPASARLARMKAMVAEEPVDLAINKLWITV